MHIIADLAQLEALYQPAPAPASLVKVGKAMTDDYRRLIQASPSVPSPRLVRKALIAPRAATSPALSACMMTRR